MEPENRRPGSDTPHVLGMVDRADLHGDGAVRIDIGCRDMLEDGIKQRQHIHVAVVRIETCIAVHCTRVDSREVELLVTCAQLEHELEDLIEDFVGTRARAVDLVDDDDGHQIEAESMLENETRLRHGALEGIDQQQDAVGHLEHTLDLAAEVGMAGVSMTLIFTSL